MLTVIGFILSISILTFIHEFGHYYIAKSFGVAIEEFSIGFGKELYARVDKEGVRWKICAIPFGGFVKMYGYANPISINITTVANIDKAFYTKPLHARFFIVVAGPLANYLLAIVIIAGFYFSFGSVEIPAIISEVEQNSPAEKSGLQVGDKIIEADGKKINKFSDLQKRIIINPNQPIHLLVDRHNELIRLPITPINNLQNKNSQKMKIGYIGIRAENKPNHINMGFLRSCYQSVIDVVDMSGLTLKALGQIVTGKRSLGEIYGPFTIAQESGNALSHSPLDFILFIAMLSVNLGLINLLPIPILDGGHLALIIYEAIAQKAPSQLVQNILLRAGMLIIIFLIVISISNDIKTLIF
jgi:regulator of sigma E protease